MKTIAKTLLAGLMLLPAFSMRASAQSDKYSQLADELIEAGSEFQGKKIAIIPFSYADNRAGATKDGSVISERLSMKLINKHKFEIVERAMLDKVMGELKLQSSGIMDVNSTQQLGKLLGVQAIITGTMIETENGEIEVNARMIKTETAQAVGASQVTVQKDWIGDAASAPQPRPQKQPRYQQPEYEQPAYAQQQPVYAPQQQEYAPQQEYAQPQQKQKNYAREKSPYAYGYFDMFYGMGSPNMKLEFHNSNGDIYLSDLNVYDPSDPYGYNSYTSVEWDKLKTGGIGPIAMRFGSYGGGNVGGAFEIGYEKRNIKPQSTKWSLDYGTPEDFTFRHNDYLTVSSFYMGGALMVRFTKGSPVEPYIGLGLGISLNSINMPYVYGLTGSSASVMTKPTTDFGVGLVADIPFGLRFKLGPAGSKAPQLFTEVRYQLNTMSFDRGISGERDVLTLSGVYFNAGISINY